MKKKNIIIIGICLLLIGAAAALSLVISNRPGTLPEEAPAAAGYVYITAGGVGRWFELPEAETSMTLSGKNMQGQEIRNVIALMPDGAYMKESTCDNQDCVHQGVVTLENKNSRVLQNMILCLPNNVTIELFAASEVVPAAEE